MLVRVDQGVIAKIENGDGRFAFPVFAARGRAALDMVVQLLRGYEIDLALRQGKRRVQGKPVFLPVLYASVIDLDVGVSCLLDGNCRAVGEYSPVSHTVGDDQLVFLVAEKGGVFFGFRPGKVD